MKRFYLAILVTLFSVGFSVAQEYSAVASKSELSVSGTSTMHDWECKVGSFTGSVNATVTNGSVTALKDFKFSFKVKSLESGKSGMDKKTYEALKEDKYPTISYSGTSVVMSSGGKAVFKGNMTIAGVTKSFEAPVTVGFYNNQIQLKGEQAFKLQDFNIEPPTAVFGTIKTGETVTIHYSIDLATK